METAASAVPPSVARRLLSLTLRARATIDLPGTASATVVVVSRMRSQRSLRITARWLRSTTPIYNFLPRASDFARYPRDGSGNYRSHLDNARVGFLCSNTGNSRRLRKVHTIGSNTDNSKAWPLPCFIAMDTFRGVARNGTPTATVSKDNQIRHSGGSFFKPAHYRPYAIGGILQAPHCFSSAAATTNTCSSCHGRPTICTPMGRPSGERPTGTTAPGLPNRLKNSE